MISLLSELDVEDTYLQRINGSFDILNPLFNSFSTIDFQESAEALLKFSNSIAESTFSLKYH